jgi:hypothetical protein
MKIGETSVSVHSVTSFHILVLYTDNAAIDFNGYNNGQLFILCRLTKDKRFTVARYSQAYQYQQEAKYSIVFIA